MLRLTVSLVLAVVVLAPCALGATRAVLYEHFTAVW